MKTLKVALLALGLAVVALPAMTAPALAHGGGPIGAVVRAVTHPVATALRTPARVAAVPYVRRAVTPVRHTPAAVIPGRAVLPRLIDPTPRTPGIFR